MRAVVYFFALWLLVLTGVPCPDADCHAHTAQTNSSSTSHSDDDSDHQAPCSPFCHCTICPGFAIPRLFGHDLPTLLSVSTTIRNVFSYQPPAYTNVAFAIWQPPKC